MAGRVIVLGSVNMDLVLRVERHPLPGETLAASGMIYMPGGKGANQAVAAARMGAPTSLVGRTGDDAYAGPLRDFLASEQIDLRHLRTTTDSASGVAVILLTNAGENMITVSTGANGRVSAADLAGLSIDAGDVLLGQFEAPLAAIGAFFSLGQDAGATTVLNPSPAVACPPEIWLATDIVVLNQHELASYADEPAGFESRAGVIETARRLPNFERRRVVVTLGAAGALAIEGEQVLRVESRPVEVVDTTGAGDCFTGVLAARLAAGEAFAEALTWANVAASLAVGRPGAGPSMPTRAEVKAALAADAND